MAFAFEFSVLRSGLWIVRDEGCEIPLAGSCNDIAGSLNVLR